MALQSERQTIRTLYVAYFRGDRIHHKEHFLEHFQELSAFSYESLHRKIVACGHDLKTWFRHAMQNLLRNFFKLINFKKLLNVIEHFLLFKFNHSFTWLTNIQLKSDAIKWITWDKKIFLNTKEFSSDLQTLTVIDFQMDIIMYSNHLKYIMTKLRLTQKSSWFNQRETKNDDE